jgi:hypothetical protein
MGTGVVGSDRSSAMSGTSSLPRMREARAPRSSGRVSGSLPEAQRFRRNKYAQVCAPRSTLGVRGPLLDSLPAALPPPGQGIPIRALEYKFTVTGPPRAWARRAAAVMGPHRTAHRGLTADSLRTRSRPSCDQTHGRLVGPPPVSVLVSVVPVYRRPGASGKWFRKRRRRPVDASGPRSADLESGLGASPVVNPRSHEVSQADDS